MFFLQKIEQTNVSSSEDSKNVLFSEYNMNVLISKFQFQLIPRLPVTWVQGSKYTGQ